MARTAHINNKISSSYGLSIGEKKGTNGGWSTKRGAARGEDKSMMAD